MDIEINGIDPTMIANNLTPFEPTHPGEMIKDEIEYRGITQKELAKQLGIPECEIEAVLTGKASVDNELARSLQAVLGIDSGIWLRLQSDYDNEIAKTDRSLDNRKEKESIEIINKNTRDALYEAKAGKLSGPLDVSSVDAMYRSMGL